MIPADTYRLRSNHPFDAARWSVLEKRLEARADTVPVKVQILKQDSLELSMQLSRQQEPALRAGQTLQLRLRPGTDSGFSDTAFRTLASAKALDSSQLGSLGFRVPGLWKGWTFLLQTLSPGSERVLKPGASDSVNVEPLAAGPYRLSAFQDKDGDGLWFPGSLRPWIPQEPYRVLLESLEVKPGVATDATPLLSEPGTPSSNQH